MSALGLKTERLLWAFLLRSFTHSSLQLPHTYSTTLKSLFSSLTALLTSRLFFFLNCSRTSQLTSLQASQVYLVSYWCFRVFLSFPVSSIGRVLLWLLPRHTLERRSPLWSLPLSSHLLWFQLRDDSGVAILCCSSQVFDSRYVDVPGEYYVHDLLGEGVLL